MPTAQPPHRVRNPVPRRVRPTQGRAADTPREPPPPNATSSANVDRETTSVRPRAPATSLPPVNEPRVRLATQAGEDEQARLLALSSHIGRELVTIALTVPP